MAFTIQLFMICSHLAQPGPGVSSPIRPDAITAKVFRTRPVSIPKGATPLGVNDLCGCIWQLTNVVYRNGSYTYVMLKGGSYYKPLSSWWYVQGGPQPLTHRQFLLRVSPGFERNATVGFRCVADSQ